MLKTVMQVYFQDSLMNIKFKRTAFIWNKILCNIINVFTDTFDQFYVCSLNKSFDFVQMRVISGPSCLLFDFCRCVQTHKSQYRMRLWKLRVMEEFCTSNSSPTSGWKRRSEVKFSSVIFTLNQHQRTIRYHGVTYRFVQLILVHSLL